MQAIFKGNLSTRIEVVAEEPAVVLQPVNGTVAEAWQPDNR
jgi:hypothetical protein